MPSGHPLHERLFRLDARDPDLVATLGLFDCITLWAVVEHLPYPLQTLEGLSRLMKPGAALVFSSPNGGSVVARRAGARWNMATLVEHIIFMTPRSVGWLARHLGLEVKRVRYAGVPYPLGTSPPSAEGQGLPQILQQAPQALPMCREPHGSARVSNAIRRMVGRTGAYFAQRDGGGHWGHLARDFLDLLRIGDHIEVYLEKAGSRPSS
jgi:hypothetical protein